jgi:hypothetical protein
LAVVAVVLILLVGLVGTVFVMQHNLAKPWREFAIPNVADANSCSNLGKLYAGADKGRLLVH